MREQILEALRAEQGRRLTRQSLWDRLTAGRATDDYWQAEQELVDADQIERRRGRNGGIYLLDDVPQGVGENAEQQAVVEEAAARERERDHYQDALGCIVDNWSREFGFSAVFGSVAAHQGRRQTGGKWTRPDLIVCTISDWLFWPAPQGEVRTIEVKLFSAVDVTAVYETVAHRAQAHYAYLMIVNFPQQLDKDQESDFERVLAAAGRHGVGVITARTTNDYSTWEYELDPTRSDADPQVINAFLLDQFRPAERRADFERAVKRRA